MSGVKLGWSRVQTGILGATKWFFPLILGLSLVHCNGKTQPGTNNSISNEDAQRSLDLRLKKTEEVRVHLNAIRDALHPVESALNDVAKALNAKITVDGKPADRLLSIVERLRTLLKTATESVVQFSPDGSWLLQRNLALPLGRNDYRCKTSEVEVFGHPTEDSSGRHDDLEILFSDCSSPGPVLLASAKVFSDRIEAEFYPDSLEQLANQDMKLGKCSIHTRKNSTEIHCDPILIKSGRFKAIIDPLNFSDINGSVDAWIKMLVQDPNGKLIVELNFETHPNTQSQIEVKTN